tara:strand:- start:1332 stop:1826 length:495 start_codon:yes stop_codon:yes gene_type:complete
MYKIKLLILLLISYTVTSCASVDNKEKIKLSVGYISGEYEGLLLSNKLKSNLNNFGMLDNNSKYEIRANISHSQNLYITNIDNTSDRERVTSSVQINIFDNKLSCNTHSFTETMSQFYVLASSDKFISNKSAFEKIKSDNTEYFVRKFINNLTLNDLLCEQITR